MLFQDALVAAFPKVPDDEKNNFVRTELEVFI